MCRRSLTHFVMPGVSVLILCAAARAGGDPPAKQGDSDVVTFPGRAHAAATVDVRPLVGGTLLKTLFKDGSDVAKGAVLCELDPTPFQVALHKVEADTALAEARLKRTEADFQRAQRLLAQRAISREDYDKYASDRAEAETALRVVRAQLEQAKILLQHTRVVAPISGKIGRFLVDAGNQIRGGDDAPVLVTIVSTDPIYVYFDMDERTLLRFQKMLRQRKAQDVRFSFAAALAGDEGFPHRGVIDFVDNRVNPNTGTIQVRGVLPNPDRLLTPGLSVRVRLQFDPKENGR